MATASELVAGAGDFVALPEAYLRIRALLRDPGSCIEDFARALQCDPALTARVLRVANSAFFGVSRRVDTLSLALGLMGISRLHDLVLANSLIGACSVLPAPGFDMAAFWRRSIHAGILARLLAASAGIVDNERLFVAGLLHDIGHLLMGIRIASAAADALAQSRDSMTPLHRVEREVLGFDYGEVGAELMRGWSFPENLREICRGHCEPAQARDYRAECALVHLARQSVLGADPDPHSLPFVPAPDEATLALAGLDRTRLAQALATSREQLAEALDVLMPKRETSAPR